MLILWKLGLDMLYFSQYFFWAGPAASEQQQHFLSRPTVKVTAFKMTEIIKKLQGKKYGWFRVGAVMSVAVLLGAVMSVALLLGAVMSVAVLLGDFMSVARLSGPFCRGRFVLGRFVGVPIVIDLQVEINVVLTR